MLLEIAVLVSLGRHPASGRARRADFDSRAVEMGKKLEAQGAVLRVVHAGDPAAPALRSYLGMGLTTLTVLPLTKGSNPVPALLAHLSERPPALVLAGLAAEAGEGSGLLPYLVAQHLGAAILPNLVGISWTGARIEATLAAPGGQRRQVTAQAPAVALVGHAAPGARAVAHGPASRGAILVEIIAGPAAEAAPFSDAVLSPAKQRPKRLASGGLAASAASGPITGLGASEAAEAIAVFLSERGFVRQDRRDPRLEPQSGAE